MAGQCFLCFIRPIRHTDFSLFLRFLARTYFIYKVIKTSASPANPITFPLFFAFSKTPLRFKRNVLMFQMKRPCVSNETSLCFRRNVLAFQTKRTCVSNEMYLCSKQNVLVFQTKCTCVSSPVCSSLASTILIRFILPSVPAASSPDTAPPWHG